MSKYENLDKYLEKKGKTPKTKVKQTKAIKGMTSKEQDDLLELMAKDLGYI